MLDDAAFFVSDGLRLAYYEQGEGAPIILIHGFASSARVNWLATGWFETLVTAGYRVIALDNRGHGRSQPCHDPEKYYPELMADDVRRLLDYLSIRSAHVMGYSMGARIAAFFALRSPERLRTAVFGGLGIGMVTGAGHWEPVKEALLADNVDDITDPRGLMFRKFADHTKSDRRSLAACVMTSKKELSAEQVRRINRPCLVAVGEKDDIAGLPQPLADLLPEGEFMIIPGRDHMLAVGDKIYKRGVVEFLARNQAREEGEGRE